MTSSPTNLSWCLVKWALEPNGQRHRKLDASKYRNPAQLCAIIEKLAGVARLWGLAPGWAGWGCSRPMSRARPRPNYYYVKEKGQAGGKKGIQTIQCVCSMLSCELLFKACLILICRAVPKMHKEVRNQIFYPNIECWVSKQIMGLPIRICSRGCWWVGADGIVPIAVAVAQRAMGQALSKSELMFIPLIYDTIGLIGYKYMLSSLMSGYQLIFIPFSTMYSLINRINRLHICYFLWYHMISSLEPAGAEGWNRLSCLRMVFPEGRF